MSLDFILFPTLLWPLTHARPLDDWWVVLQLPMLAACHRQNLFFSAYILYTLQGEVIFHYSLWYDKILRLAPLDPPLLEPFHQCLSETRMVS